MSQTGTCKSFNGLKGWGFIDMNGTDVFVHIKDCTDGKQPKQGDFMTFTTEPRQNNPEHMQAKNVTGGTDQKEGAYGAFAGPVEGTGAYEGTCKAFGMKGFGFITQADGSELFVHVKDCVGSRPVPGDKLKFDIRDSETKPGQQQASNVTGGTAPLVDPNQDKGMGKGAWGPSWGAPDPWSKGGGGWGAPGRIAQRKTRSLVAFTRPSSSQNFLGKMAKKLCSDSMVKTSASGSSGSQANTNFAWTLLAGLLLALSAWTLGRDECSDGGMLSGLPGVPLSASSTEALQVVLMFGLAMATSRLTKGTSFEF